MTAKGTPRGDVDGRLAAARPVRKPLPAKMMGHFYGPPPRRVVRSVGRFAARDYDPVTGQKRARP